MLNGLDLFSGIGGISLALKPWVRTVAYCESEPYAQAVLLSRMRDGSLDSAPIWDDVRTLSANHIRGPVDIITGGFPCQDISIAGTRAGLAGERSGLFFEIVRLTRELRPRFVFLENVANITVREHERVLTEFNALRYDCRWTIVSAASVGACHLRERWWLCANSMRERLSIARSQQNTTSEHRGSPRDSALAVVQAQFPEELISWLSRVDDGLSPKIHRIRCLGNAVVPIQARTAFERLSGLERMKK